MPTRSTPRRVIPIHDPAPRLRSTIDPADLRDAAAIGYAQSLTDLHRARRQWERAQGGGEVPRARAARVLHAVTVVADRAFEELLAAADACD